MSTEQFMATAKRRRVEEVKKELRVLTEAAELLARRQAIKSSGIQNVLQAELIERLREIRKAYLSVSTKSHPNQVVSALAELQGQEREVGLLMNAFEDLPERKKDIDRRIGECNSELEIINNGDW